MLTEWAARCLCVSPDEIERLLHVSHSCRLAIVRHLEI
jgi:hypothetical protein